MLSMIANPVTALPVGYPRSGLSRSDLVLWPITSIRGNAALRSRSEQSRHLQSIAYKAGTRPRFVYHRIASARTGATPRPTVRSNPLRGRSCNCCQPYVPKALLGQKCLAAASGPVGLFLFLIGLMRLPRSCYLVPKNCGYGQGRVDIKGHMSLDHFQGALASVCFR
jgi:hypothetical protein